MSDLSARIERFLAAERFAVVGASTNRDKYGNKVLRAYLQNDRRVVPVNPNADEVEGLRAYPSLDALPEPVEAVSIITPPDVTEQVVTAGLAAGIRHFWMQPGAESPSAVAAAEAAGANVIGGDACVLVVLGFRDK